MPKTEKQKILQRSEVSLRINHYDDIFSDFDSRPYAQRGLSDDFLLEAKKFTKERPSGRLELVFLVPANLRKQEVENVIKKRLHEHFRKHHHLLQQETAQLKKKGLALTLLGMLLMLAASLLATVETKKFITNVLFVILEPSGWFMVWFGLEQIFYEAKQKQPDLEFYTKMCEGEIKFKPY